MAFNLLFDVHTCIIHSQEAPPLMPTLTIVAGTQLASLPLPMYGAYLTVQDKKVYASYGTSPVDDAKHQVYVYDVNTDHWGQLRTSLWPVLWYSSRHQW